MIFSRRIGAYVQAITATSVVGFLTEPNQTSVASDGFLRMSSFDVIFFNGIIRG